MFILENEHFDNVQPHFMGKKLKTQKLKFPHKESPSIMITSKRGWGLIPLTLSAGVLENQDTRGGGVNLTPPLNPMFDVQI